MMRKTWKLSLKLKSSAELGEHLRGSIIAGDISNVYSRDPSLILTHRLSHFERGINNRSKTCREKQSSMPKPPVFSPVSNSQDHTLSSRVNLLGIQWRMQVELRGTMARWLDWLKQEGGAEGDGRWKEICEARAGQDFEWIRCLWSWSTLLHPVYHGFVGETEEGCGGGREGKRTGWKVEREAELIPPVIRAITLIF